MCFTLVGCFSVMTTSTPERSSGLKALNDAIAVIENNIKNAGGDFSIEMMVSFGFPCKNYVVV